MNKVYYIVYMTTCLINDKIYIGVHKQKGEPNNFDGYLGSGKLLNLAINKYGKNAFKRETLFYFMTDEEAKNKERVLVNEEFILRDDTYNICLGGTGGDTIKYLNESDIKVIRQKQKESMQKIDYTKIYTNEHRLLLSKLAKERINKNPNTLPDNKDRKHVGVGLENIINAGKERVGKYIWITNGEKTILIPNKTEIPNGWFNGRGNDVQKFIKHTDESKMKISNNKKIKGIVNYTDGKTNIKLQPNEQPPDGFYKGMTQKKKNTIWITNGIENKMIKLTDSIPCNWKRGRTINKGEKND